jgi:flavin-dependent dehydrogenase
MRTDLLVVGAGPAGCAAAAAALRAVPGLSVTLVDAAAFPRDKPCGGAITGGGLAELAGAGLALRVPAAAATHAVIRVQGISVRTELPRPAAVVRRREWDADLVAQVRARGALVLEKAALLGLPEPNVAETAAGRLSYLALVAADGAGGASRRALGLPAGRRAPGREAVLASRGNQDLVFDLDVGLPGYAWRFPCRVGGSQAESVGTFALGGGGGLGEALGAWALREGLAPPADAAPWSLRLAEPGGPVGAGSALLAGEALGADPLTGEGIRYALWSGRIAGELAARAARAGAAPSLRAYRRRLWLSRSGVTLGLLSRLGPRLHGGERRFRAMAADREVVRALASLVSGAPPAAPLASLLGRYLALAGGRGPWRTPP